MNIQQKRDFLTNLAYWGIIALGVYLGFEYLLPVSVPILLGILVAWMVVKLSRLLRCTHRLVRIGLTILIYGLIGLVITWLSVRAAAAVSGIIKWLPEVYELKLLPFATLCYQWGVQTVEHLDPALITTLESLLEGLLSGLKTMISYMSGVAVNVVSGLATGIPSLILSLLAMIFTTIFVVADYEGIASFTEKFLPRKAKYILNQIRFYLTNTLFVVIRSYLIIMVLTFTELSILFRVFGIEHGVLKAAIIALLDILPVLGTGGIMIPWAVISLVLGYTKLGLELLLIYIIVTVVRNYVEPKVVGTQLGLHPIITLVSMFIGLRLFGFWGLFGLPVGISFLWKQKQEKETPAPEQNSEAS